MKQLKKAKTTLFLTPPTENPEPKSKMFIFSVQTRRLHESFEGLYSSLASSSGKLSRVIASYSSRQWETHAFSDFGGKMFFFSHNFGCRHARRSSKDSINVRDHLVSNKNLSQNFAPLDWRPGPVKVGQKNENVPTLRASPRRTPHPNKKMFVFNRTNKSFRICRGYEQHSSYCSWRVIT